MKRPRDARVPAKSNARQWLNDQDFTAKTSQPSLHSQAFTAKTSRRERGRAFEVAAAPVHADDGPAVRERAVLKVERRARALQQGFGDEEAQPQAARLAVAALSATVGDVGLADPVHDLRGKAWTVIGDGDGDILTVPGGGDLDPLVGEIDGVLEQIPQAVEDGGVAPADRLGRLARRERDVDRNAEVA